ncbi:MAG: sigma 54-interacting transcriptional regulator [bacterium]|nr:sigma 54-interacting transcriptional regulator [bacterium]
MNNINYKKFFEILLDACKLINSSFDLNIALERIIQAVTQSMHCEGASLLLLNKKTNHLYFKSATGNVAEEIKNLKIKMGEGIAGWVAKNRKSLLVPDVERDPRHNKDIDLSTGFVTRSIIAAPVEYQGDILGIVEVLNPHDKDYFSAEDLILLEALTSQVAIAIRYCDAFAKLNQENIELKKVIGLEQTIIGQSKALADVLRRAEKIAPFDVTVLITGESGTGKELLAREIHSNSHRSEKPYIPINCSALPEHLIESELFGHERGAFTGAVAARKGKFESASGGTLFLDEIGDMGLSVQAKILRALETGIHMRVGGDTPIKTDVRIIAATNKDLRKMVEEGTFREDLFYRLYEMHILLPALHERKGDIPLLINHFIKVFASSFHKT